MFIFIEWYSMQVFAKNVENFSNTDEQITHSSDGKICIFIFYEFYSVLLRTFIYLLNVRTFFEKA